MIMMNYNNCDEDDDDDVEVVCKSKHGTGRPRRPHWPDSDRWRLMLIDDLAQEDDHHDPTQEDDHHDLAQEDDPHDDSQHEDGRLEDPHCEGNPQKDDYLEDNH